jgi:fumarate hydratase, class II
MANKKYRIEKDVLGELEVPEDVYWGVNTQRAIQNFSISGKTFPKEFIRALAIVKQACLQANFELELIDKEKKDAILRAISEIVVDNQYYNQFPIDIFQTGSGTQTNMNMNEVLANRANQILGSPMGKKTPIHPNDHLNKSQSSNDVIPASMHLAALVGISNNLIPILQELIGSLDQKIKEYNGIVKVGRTHLQDAVPIPLSMEFEVYRSQISKSIKRINRVCEELYELPLGGTALGTGIGAHPKFSLLVSKHLSKISKFPFKPNKVLADGIASHNVLVGLSGVLKQLALSLMKMANDIRWMGSGPRAGLGELILPANEPGSSIMPGKINPTQSEALIQVCLQVIGNDTAITFGEGYGSLLDLNVCKPLIIVNLLESIAFLSGAIKSFIHNCLNDLAANRNNIETQIGRILMVVTNIAPQIGYDKASEIAQKAFRDNKTIKEIIIDEKIEISGDLDALLDPKNMIN